MLKGLANVRILDFSRAVAGAYGSLLLADLGAEVIKIEQPPQKRSKGRDEQESGEAVLLGGTVSEKAPTDEFGRRLWRRAMAHFQSLNRNKKRIALNLEIPKGREVFHELVKRGDIVYDNFRPHIPKLIGIDFETLQKVNPRIISCSVTGFGETGPMRNAAGIDVILQALGGEMSMTGLPGMPPCRSGLAIADLDGAIFATIGMLTALRERDATGKGVRVDMSMLDVMVSLLNYRVGVYSAIGELMGPVGSGHAGSGQIPYGAYECADGRYMVVAGGGPKHWSLFIRAFGLPELENDPRFSTNSKRQQNVEAITGILEGVFLTKTAEEWEKIFFEAGVPSGMVKTLPEVISMEQVKSRDMVVEIEQPIGEKWTFAGNPVKIRGNTDTFKAAPGVGENTEEVLSSVLGYSKEYIAELRQMGVWDKQSFEDSMLQAAKQREGI